MKLTRLRIAGFKTFVEPTDFLIEPGLTGVVGPNGCGKSNLVEALRWVMGESSYKNMRASGMDDVIFSGSGGRPPRNVAEVTITVDNTARVAPAAFNDADMLEITRRIERAAGSIYRINSREARARDVQILFADAATGARSPTLVRQGQIGELIAAKPQARRRILEDAAGIAGLHVRRHEAELRLKAAEDNLVRAEDVLREIAAQIDSLKRQARQATRYRTLSAEIRRFEALIHAIGHAEARQQAAAAMRQAEEDFRLVTAQAELQTKAATVQAVTAQAVPPLREVEAVAAAALQRLTHARHELDMEERRAKERLAELERQVAELDRDIAREAEQRTDAEAQIGRLQTEEQALRADGDAREARQAAQERSQGCEAALTEAEAVLAAIQAQVADMNARRAALERTIRDESERSARFAAEKAHVEKGLAALDAALSEIGMADRKRAELATAETAAQQAEMAAATARKALAESREAEQALRVPFAEADRALHRLEAEVATLEKLFAPATGKGFPPVLDRIVAAKGYETALAAALGDDLDAASDPAAPQYWAGTGPVADDPALPPGIAALAEWVQAPPELQRRLRQIGIVDQAEGERLRHMLRPGQRLVSLQGDLWRWDGFAAKADAPSAAARRLEAKNRLDDLRQEAVAARDKVEALRKEAELAQGVARSAAARETEALEAARKARGALDGIRDELTAIDRREAETVSRRSALREAATRVAASEAEAMQRMSEARAALAALVPAPEIEQQLLTARTSVAEYRAKASEARATHQTLLREADLRAKRLETVLADCAQWAARVTRSVAASTDLAERLARARAEHKALIDAPDAFLLRRRALLQEHETAEHKRKAAADNLAEAESALVEADRVARAALESLANAREQRAGSLARAEAAGIRQAELERAILETFATTPDKLCELAQHAMRQPLPSLPESEERLAVLKVDRDRLGAVNLRAEEELQETEAKHQAIAVERDDLIEAIKRLRQAIFSLSREGRERLLAAFAIVNGHFKTLFTQLFGGGEAELTLVDADDPLEAGLEILARPPGKKPQTMTLLSGGEQALTAIALIFAVFLTNPSPICVLDEVDAPLDDANVERYCDLLHNMAQQTETRFVVITHNPITMARMNRLFGVTMAERGVSQLVSVDLEGAERLREAV